MGDSEQRWMPLKAAYAFAARHGLDEDVDKIREMEIRWERSYTSSVRRGYLIDLLEQHGLWAEFVKECWTEGATPWGQKKASFFKRIGDEYKAWLNGPDTGQEGEARFEAHLRDYLARNLHLVEKGLRLYERDGRSGVEFAIDNGRIDILAVDKNDRFVVFELKVSRGRNKTLGQLLYYMGWVDKHLGKEPCRGVIVASEITPDLRLAAKRAGGVLLYGYTLSMTVSPVSVE